MKKILSVVLSIVMVLSLIPVYAVPATAESAGETEPHFSVDVSGNTFTISRTDSSTTQTVAYRTVSVTAVEGIHFTRTVGTVTFNEGEWYKIITVTETAVNDIPIRYRYQSGKYREYRFEVLDGYGLLLASGRRLIDYGDDYKFNNASINSTVNNLFKISGGSGASYYGDVLYEPSNNKLIQVKDSGYKQAVHTVSTASIFTLPGLAPREYLSAIGDKLYAAVRFSEMEENDGYQYIQILADNESTFDGDDSNGTVSTPSVSYYKACFERDKGTNANSTSCYMIFPHRYDYKNQAEENSAGISPSEFYASENYIWAQAFRNNSVKAPNAGAVLLDPTTQNVNIRFDAAGSGSDTWDFSSLWVRYAIGDETAPTPVDSLYVSQNSPNIKHSPVTITICFNEIVRPFNCVLKTTWGDLPVINSNGYANVLSFCGPITANQGTQLKITGIEGTVTDLFGKAMNVTISKSLSYTVGQSPSVPSSNGVYLISNAAELYSYADMLETYPNRSGRLMADIDMSNSEFAGFTAMAGTNGFTGTFDGNGHKILNLQNVSGTSNGMCGLFGYVSAGGRVQNLDIDISFIAPLGSSGAICGFNLGTVENCIVSGSINNSIADSEQSTSSNRFGGVVGDNRGNVNHCLALNELSNKWENPVFGGVVGYNGGTVNSCCFYGIFGSSKTITRGAICGENASNGTITNCAARNLNSNYYSYAIGSNNGTATNTLYMSSSDFASGKACYDVLNNGVSDGTQFWYQNINNGLTPDECPQFTGGTVYKHGNDYTNTPVVHTLSHVDEVEAGCETSGCAEHWVCTYDGCGKIFSDANGQNETTLSALALPAIGHNWSSSWFFNDAGHRHKCTRCDAVKDEAPHTCSAPSYEWNSDNTQVTASHYCDVCHCIIDRQTVNTAIDYGTVSCTEGGTVTYTATFTKDGFTTQTKQVSMDALGHDYVATVTEPTCTETGFTTHTCSRCGDTYVDSQVAALGHDYAATVTEPTCTQIGFTTHTCSHCGDTYIDSQTAALGHSWDSDWSCDSSTHFHECSRCGEKKDEAAHTYGAATYEWSADNSTVTAKHYCETCNYLESETVNTDVQYDTVDCSQGGTVTYTASFTKDCFATQTKSETASSFEHDYVSAVTNPTCTEQGYTTHTCLRCGLEYTDSYTDALGGDHVWDTYRHSNGTHHWHACSICYAKKDIEPHAVGEPEWTWNFGVSASATFVCTVCGADGLYYNADITTSQTGNTVTVTATVSAFGNTYTDVKTYPVLALGENTVQIEDDNSVYYFFTPSEDADYRFYSTGEYDPKISMYDEAGQLIERDDDSGEGRNFILDTFLESGKQYCIALYSYDHTGDLTVLITKPQTHSITIGSTAEHGRVWIENEAGNEVTTAYGGDVLYIDYDADSGYRIDRVTITDSSGNPVSISSKLSFTMPESDITVSPAPFVSTALNLGENSAFIKSYTDMVYSFTPSQSGYYRFYSVGDIDPRIKVYDGETQVGYDNDGGEGNNFNLIVSLEAGKTYKVILYSFSDIGFLTVFITKPQIRSIMIDSTVENGRVWIENADGNQVTEAYEGQNLIVAYETDSGYRPDSITVTDSGGNPVDLDSTCSFYMPESDITVSAQFVSNVLYSGENIVFIHRGKNLEYSFTPSQSGDYRFYSVGNYDPKIDVYYGETLVGLSDDDGDDHNFDVTVTLEAGKTYTVYIYTYGTLGHQHTGLMTMFIEKDGLTYDINSDGVEDINDIGFIISASAGNIEMNWVQKAKADLNGDTVVDAFDAAWLDRHYY